MATGYEEFETKMRKTSENLSTNLASVRAGRANAAVLDQITVDYYGTPTPTQQVASIKQVKKYAEEAKVAIRNIRRDAMDSFKTQKKNGDMTEDDVKIAEKDFQKITDDWIKEIDKIADKKEKELFEI